jgi:hypothetical protein
MSSPAAAAPENDAPCAVQLFPSDAGGDWRRASAELRQRVRRWPQPDRDCRQLRIDVGEGGALLTITTQDGRQAERLVATPAALVPAASALVVSVETAPAPAPSPAPRSPSENAAVEMRSRDRVGFLFAGGGLRLAMPGTFWSPALRGGLALAVNGWELGTFVDWSPRHWLTADEVPPRFSMWSLSSGIAAGRRERVGGVDLLAGVMFGATFVHQESTTEERNDDTIEIEVEEGAGVDPMFAGYFGVATPRGKPVRLRTQLEIALPLSHPGETRELDSDLPPLPGWSLTGVVGAEFDAL